MKNILVAVAAFILSAALSVSSYAQGTAETKDQLIGTWKVETLEAKIGNKLSYPLGERPTGYMTMTSERMWLLFVDSQRNAPMSTIEQLCYQYIGLSLIGAEALEMMTSHASWTGKYTTAEQTPDGIKVTAHVDTASTQAIVGKDRVYFMHVNGNKLTVKSPGVVVPMTGAISVLEFQLIKAQ